MNIYQKAIEVKNECKSRKKCDECKYTNYCLKTEILFYCPSYEDIKLIAKAIKEEKWEIN